MFTVTILKVAPIGNNPNVYQLINELWYIYITEYCSAIKRDEVLTYAHMDEP